MFRSFLWPERKKGAGYPEPDLSGSSYPAPSLRREPPGYSVVLPA